MTLYLETSSNLKSCHNACHRTSLKMVASVASFVLVSKHWNLGLPVTLGPRNFSQFTAGSTLASSPAGQVEMVFAVFFATMLAAHVAKPRQKALLFGLVFGLLIQLDVLEPFVCCRMFKGRAV